MYSDKSNERMVGIMQSLGAKAALPIATAIEEMEDLDRKLADMGADTETGSELDHSTDSEAPTRGTSYERDAELEREEKLITALGEKRKLEERLAELSDELKEAREKAQSLEEELTESKFTLDRRRLTTMDEENLQQLSLQAGRDKDYIAELETDLANANSTIEQQDRQLERLKGDAESKQELRDELQLIKSERDELRQKAKANENLKKKIQALQEHERSNANLRRDLQGAQEQMQETDMLKERCAALEKASEENAKTIANGEQEIFDQKTAKEHLKHELKVLNQRYEQTRDMLGTAQETIRDLEDRFQDMQSSQDSPRDLNDLDTELNTESGAVEESDKKSTRRKSVVPSPSADSIVNNAALTCCRKI